MAERRLYQYRLDGGLDDVTPAKMKLQGLGSHLHDLMELWKIDKGDTLAGAESLS